MEQHKLSFTKINKLSDNLAELIVNEGVEIDLEMVNELDLWYQQNLQVPFGLLVNKENPYTYTFEVQMKIGDFSGIAAIGVVTYSKISRTFTDLLKKLPRKNKWNMEMFDNRQEAIKWIESELAKNKGI